MKMRAIQVAAPGGAFELVQRDVPEPGAGQVRIKVEACGICHSDSLTKLGAFPGIRYPRVPGHEVVGLIDAVGAGVPEWQPGQRVGVGWHGSHCGYCASCRRGDFVTCVRGQIPGISYDGGYAEYMIAPFEALALVPPELKASDAAPLLCAGVTTFNSLRHSGAGPGDLVGVLGVGGLGHLGVQFAARMGCRTVAIARGKDKEPLARKLGAQHYIDSEAGDVAGELNRLGGAAVIISTVTNAAAMSAVLGGLAPNGKLILLGVAREPIEVPSMLMVGGRRSICGWPSGSSRDSEDALSFSVLAGVLPMIETMPLEQAAKAYDRMMSGAARFRMVLTMGS
jgi:D-arabinose 1-dehydrogenase-like Zn-dependent alcohol dehydrogenase